MVDKQSTNAGLRELALFAGAGGGILGGKLLGWRTVCAVERDAYAAAVLAQRQNDGLLDIFPIWSDVETFDGRPWRGIVDVVSGGFPCQDISCAGKGAGIEGKQSGLWSEMARIIGEVRPRFAFVENVPALTARGLGRVLGDLAEMGYDAEWCVLGAHHVGAPHKRERIWILAADTNSSRELQSQGMFTDERRRTCNGGEGVAYSEGINRRASVCKAQQEQYRNLFGYRRGDISNADHSGCEEQWESVTTKSKQCSIECGSWWLTEPDVGRVVNGMAFRVDRIKALGNGQVPAVAATAWEILSERRIKED